MIKPSVKVSKTKEMIIGVVPEGPIAYDGVDYRYSKGERLYLDKLSENFKALDLLSLVLVEGDNAYETCLHSSFSSDLLHIYELPRQKSKKPSILSKVFHLLKIFLFFCKRIPKVDIVYIFLPSYPGAMAWVVAKIFKKNHIVYGADDWVTASESMFKWENYKGTRFYKTYVKLNSLLEKYIVKTAIFSVVAGGQLKQKYEMFGCQTFHTSPRMTLSKKDIFERVDTFQGKSRNIIHVGALIHDKAQHILLKVFSECYKRDNTLTLTIIGDGPLRSTLESQAHKLGIGLAVDFVGYVEKEKDLYKYLKSADAFLLTSVTEGFHAYYMRQWPIVCQ